MRLVSGMREVSSVMQKPSGSSLRTQPRPSSCSPTMAAAMRGK